MDSFRKEVYAKMKKMGMPIQISGESQSNYWKTKRSRFGFVTNMAKLSLFFFVIIQHWVFHALKSIKYSLSDLEMGTIITVSDINRDTLGDTVPVVGMGFVE